MMDVVLSLFKFIYDLLDLVTNNLDYDLTTAFLVTLVVLLFI